MADFTSGSAQSHPASPGPGAETEVPSAPLEVLDEAGQRLAASLGPSRGAVQPGLAARRPRTTDIQSANASRPSEGVKPVSSVTRRNR
jgi:hypothetical protein